LIDLAIRRQTRVRIIDWGGPKMCWRNVMALFPLPYRMLTLIGVLAIVVSSMPQAHAEASLGSPTLVQRPTHAEREFPRAWFMGNDAQRRAQNKLVGQYPPPLSVSRWLNEPQMPASLRGKVVVVEFWATWCVPCIRTFAMNRRLVEEYTAQGFAFIGIHDGLRGLDRLDSLVEEQKVLCSIGVDDGTKSAEAWRVSFWPTYAVIDRTGIVRAVGLYPEYVPTVVRKLIAEPVPAIERLAPD
jgi:thiol-disulfide isomerase/thioredoxin